MTALALLVGLLSWPAPDAARTSAQQVVREESLQAELPGDVAARPPPLRSTSTRGGGRRSSGSSTPRGDRGSALGPAVLWIVGVLLLVGLAAVFLRERIGPSAPAVRDTAAPPRPPPPPDRTIIDEADALAAAGRFADAVHALLLRTIQALGSHMPVPRALTSREIEARAGLPDQARAAFGDLVEAVELTRFGGRPAGADDYARCVACFERIRAALGGA